MIESLSEAASEGEGVRTLEPALDRLAESLQAYDDEAGPVAPLALGSPADDKAVDRLFRHLVPDVTGRRSGAEIVERMRRKWVLGRSLHDVLKRVREQVRSLAELKGPAAEVLPRLDARYEDSAPRSVAAVRDLMAMLERLGVDLGRVEIDLGFGRGIGFYTKLIFELSIQTPDGEVEVCGGGRYDGLARVLGGSPDRDDRGAGFAFGLERLDQALRAASAASASSGGFLIVGRSPEAGLDVASTATFLRDRLDLPVVVAELPFEEAVPYAQRSGLDKIVSVGTTVEVWNLQDGDVRQATGGELVDQLRARLAVVRGDAR